MQDFIIKHETVDVDAPYEDITKNESLCDHIYKYKRVIAVYISAFTLTVILNVARSI